jgi:hypothetical protein
MNKIVTFIALAFVFSFGYMMANSYAAVEWTEGGYSEEGGPTVERSIGSEGMSGFSTTQADDDYRFFGLEPYWTEGGYAEEVSPTIEKPIGSEGMSGFSTTGEEYLYEHQYLWP